ARFVGNFFHQRARLRDYSLQGMMAVGEFEKFQRELKTLIGQHLRNIAALGKANEHAENFSHCSAQVARNLAGGQPFRPRCEQLQDVQSLV
ncbi:MAG: hypothetical protein WAK78_00250, partial [Candidatus Acidiferrales bacterium]